MQFQFTPCQLKAYDALKEVKLWRINAEYHLLTGAAGTGKTTLVSYLVKHYIQSGYKVYCSALTHKAAAVMRAMIKENKIEGVSVDTIHKLLGLVVNNNTDTGNTNLRSTDKSDISTQSILLVDEISMADDEVYGYIKKAAEKNQLMVVFIGDINQLPPVNKAAEEKRAQIETVPLSPVFSDEGVTRHELLTTVRAANDSPITQLARRFIASSDLPPQDELLCDGGEIILSNGTQFLELAKNFVTQCKNNGIDNHSVVLAHKNTIVSTYNDKLRQHEWGHASPFQAGERLVCNDLVQARDQDNLTCAINNNELVTVHSAYFEKRFGLNGYVVTLQCGRVVFAAESTGELLRMLRHMQSDAKRERVPLKRSSLWREYFATKGMIADLRPTYAMTVHKSQSSSYNHVLIDMADIHIGNNLAMVKHLCYTAMTRAKQSIVLTGHEAFWNAQITFDAPWMKDKGSN